MHKLWLLLAFVLLSQEARGSRTKPEWGRDGGDYVDWIQDNKPNAPSNGGVNSESIILEDCLRSCPVTSEYNPICGTDNVTYDNPGRLICAQNCGVNVVKKRPSRC